MTMTSHTPSTQVTRSYPALHIPLRTLLAKLRATLVRRAKPDAVSRDDPWAGAIGQVEHLDAYVLTDIGAPKWVIDEVSRRQRNDGILDVYKKW
ncbi:hypothetical protein CAP48_08590 [Advenella sp. S44]|uniref:hypothetical protein n=1 Tax=Advenella sp. S44 TaxID=1982755 RepID=UPI000C29993B|nr:hypothetical protein [Advenella sp. S44]PJX26064.1 hypothetical protein CAP48_08590 [Advenella sp. S44]